MAKKNSGLGRGLDAIFLDNSRTENKEHSPSLKLFYSMVNALGYDLKLVKI